MKATKEQKRKLRAVVEAVETLIKSGLSVHSFPQGSTSRMNAPCFGCDLDKVIHYAKRILEPKRRSQK